MLVEERFKCLIHLQIFLIKVIIHLQRRGGNVELLFIYNKFNIKFYVIKKYFRFSANFSVDFGFSNF